jgi:hypothetical protein
MKTLSKAVAVASLLSAGIMSAQVANAVEVGASAAVSNMYLWRGKDLGNSSSDFDGDGKDDQSNGGVAAVSGDLNVSMGGAYAGVWTSSGDANGGQEYDLYVGYGMETGPVAIDASVWTYVYPSGGTSSDSMFDLSELIVSASVGDASVTWYETLTADSAEYRYITLGYGMDKVSATLGLTLSDTDATEYTHLDVSYAATENLSFTYSQIVDEGVEGSYDTNGKVVATLSLPIE